ncbi:hypothetical protein [Nocardiopsis alba]|uniref:Uncharacterized protein n=2 Tax=Nocardiopsis alba TaxID=53437 RepID=J7L4D9_NOCAA|nr:hypothetical protein [Nocardiopsis alba]AFR06295.1 hypothetical protein B005_2289 [Nocardiopsis alba ATCC BAA-2165]
MSGFDDTDQTAPERREVRWTLRAREPRVPGQRTDPSAPSESRGPRDTGVEREAETVERPTSAVRDDESPRPGSKEATRPREGERADDRRTPAPDSTGSRSLRPHGMDAAEVRRRWREIQGGFVDGPGESVLEADALAAEITEALVTALERRRAALRAAWDGDEKADTETLRLALREYRAFIQRLNGDEG